MWLLAIEEFTCAVVFIILLTFFCEGNMVSCCSSGNNNIHGAAVGNCIGCRLVMLSILSVYYLISMFAIFVCQGVIVCYAVHSIEGPSGELCTFFSSLSSLQLMLFSLEYVFSAIVCEVPFVNISVAGSTYVIQFFHYV